MSVSIEFANGVWVITDPASRRAVQADQVIADLEFVRGQPLRGKVVTAYGVPMEQVANLSAFLVHTFGIHTPTHRISAPPRWARRYRLSEGGKIEPYVN